MATFNQLQRQYDSMEHPGFYDDGFEDRVEALWDDEEAMAKVIEALHEQVYEELVKIQQERDQMALEDMYDYD